MQPSQAATPAAPLPPIAAYMPLFLPTTYQPGGDFLLTWQDGRFCPADQPEWSAYRELAFGHGEAHGFLAHGPWNNSGCGIHHVLHSHQVLL